MRATTRLRQMLKEPGIIVAPGAYDGFSATPLGPSGGGRPAGWSLVP